MGKIPLAKLLSGIQALVTSFQVPAAPSTTATPIGSSMDLLENQVSDLRSFLGAGASEVAAPQAAETAAPAHEVAGYAQSPGPLRSTSHHSSLSALGDNSAPHHHHQPPSPLGSSNSTNAKRRANEAEDGPAKQQRSKRNRVCFSFWSCSRDNPTYVQPV